MLTVGIGVVVVFVVGVGVGAAVAASDPCLVIAISSRVEIKRGPNLVVQMVLRGLVTLNWKSLKFKPPFYLFSSPNLSVICRYYF